MTVELYRKLFPTLKANLSATGNTCKLMTSGIDCHDCELALDDENKHCYLDRSNEEYEQFLLDHPEFLL